MKAEKKKILALLLVLLLAVGCFGCSKTSDDQEEGGDLSTSQEEEQQEDGEEAVKSGEYDEEVNEDDSDIAVEDYDAEGLEASFDFGFSTGKTFGLSKIVEQVSYGDLSSLDSDLESKMESAISSALGGTYEIFSDYEEDEDDELDQLIYAIAMEDNDVEGRYLEGGVYHTQSGKNYQYISLASSNYYSVSSSDIDTIIQDAKNAMGITLSKSRLTKAIQIAFDNATQIQDYYSLSDSRALKGDGYTETVKVTVDGFATEEDEIGYYVYLERERCYS